MVTNVLKNSGEKGPQLQSQKAEFYMPLLSLISSVCVIYFTPPKILMARTRHKIISPCALMRGE